MIACLASAVFEESHDPFHSRTLPNIDYYYSPNPYLRGPDGFTPGCTLNLNVAAAQANLSRLTELQGYKNVPIDDVVRVRDHGVSPEYLADMKELGLKDLTLAQIVRLRDHGITPGFVNHARARGYTTTDPDELVRLKNGGLWK